MGRRLAKRVLLIGWDAADWQMINPLLDSGRMPALQSLVDQGAIGNLATLQPVLSPMLWTSIATGKRPHKHGIHGFVEPTPDGAGIRPSTSTTRRCKALWNMLTQEGLDTHTVGWFCSHPAEPINGVSVSSLFGVCASQNPDEWELPEGTVHPASLAETLAELRLHPSELSAEQILAFVPRAAEINQQDDPRLGILARILAQCASVHAAATWILEKRPWDFLTVYYGAIDHMGHWFMRHHPPRMPNVPEEDFELYQGVMTACYRFHDMMLGRLLHLAGDDTTVVLCSDHGFLSGDARPAREGRADDWHRNFGVICMKGPHIRKDERVYGAGVLDITPTVLTLFGLPVDREMDGKPLADAFEDPVEVERIPSWDAVEGEAGLHPIEKRQDPYAAREAMQQLVALGYVDPESDGSRAVAMSEFQAKDNLARSHVSAGRHEDAARLFEDLVAASPRNSRMALRLATCYLRLRRLDEARAIVEAMLDRQQARARRLAHRIADLGNVQDGSGTEGGKRQQQLRRLKKRLERLKVRAMPRPRLVLAVLDLVEGNTRAALDHLKKAEKAEPDLPGIQGRLGRVYLRMRLWRDARRAFEKALEIDPESSSANEGLSGALLHLGKHRQAAEAALNAVGLLYFHPLAHLRLGMALAGLRSYPRAIEAFEACLKMAPTWVPAHRWLARIHARLGHADLARHHLAEAQTLRRRAQPEQRRVPA